MPPRNGCPPRGPPSPEVTGAFCRVPSTPFSQAPWYALPVHLCRFRVRSMKPGLFPGPPSKPGQSDKSRQRPAAVTPGRPWSINQVPIGCGFRPHLRGRLTLSGLALLRNPWTFGERVSHPLDRYSCQHSHFRYLQHGSRHAFTGLRNAPLPSRGQMTEDRGQKGVSASALQCCARLMPLQRQLLWRPCSMRAISWYSSRQRRHVSSSM